jgi:hypothetical protein
MWREIVRFMAKLAKNLPYKAAFAHSLSKKCSKIVLQCNMNRYSTLFASGRDSAA